MTDQSPPDAEQVLHITKLDAARRQLGTALQLWFDDGDPVSVHVLAFSAYDVIHAVSKKRNPRRRDLLFDSALMKDEYRGEWAVWLKTPSGFFKHARNDPEGTIDFNPLLSEPLMMFAILGLDQCAIDPAPTEYAFLLFLAFRRPSLFSEEGRKLFLERLHVDDQENIRGLPKRLFLSCFLQGSHARGRIRR